MLAVGLDLVNTDCLPRRMSAPAACEWLCARHGGDKARRLVRLEQQKARRARSRKRYAYWTAVAAELDADRGAPALEAGPRHVAAETVL